MKTLFFGSSEFALPSLRAAARRTELQAAVTQPDRPAGRGHQLRPTPVKAEATALRLPVLEPASLREFAQTIRPGEYDLFVLASFGRILPQQLLELPRLGALNVHPSLLPKYRGATPLQHVLLDGESETGVSIMLMDAGMDTGDLVLQEATAIAPEETYGELHDRLADLGAQLLVRAIDLAQSGDLPHHPQEGPSSLTRPLRKEDLGIDWHWPVRRIVNTIRAFSPAPAARAQIGGASVKILRAREGPPVADCAPGAIVGTQGDALRVRCGDASVDVLSLIPPNRPAQSGAAFAHAIR